VGGLPQLRGRSVLLATKDQLTTALALIELDGIASRLVLCPPDLPLAHIQSTITAASTDVIVTEAAGFPCTPGVKQFVVCTPQVRPAVPDRSGHCLTEWVLLTSGTTGWPKLVVHTLSSLSEAARDGGKANPLAIWSTFYDIRRYGGLQIFLRALLGGGSLVLAGMQEQIGDFLVRLGARGVTHISGTPSHWRRTLMSSSACAIEPQYIRLSGEIADQPILNQLRDFYRGASIAHAFATTEAGVGFDVHDGLAGFPADLIGRRGSKVQMKVVNGSLWIRSARVASFYLAHKAAVITDPEGFVDTGDMVELHRDRYLFVGRRDGVINVGGLKVHPEKVEAVINGHPNVQISRVKAQRNPVTGSIVTADVVWKPQDATIETDALKTEITEACHRLLAAHEVPAIIRLVSTLDLTASGKLARTDA
jgi:acyl-coenzyme A synthetase/AMP-(fatty) acid ligase